MSGMTRIGKQGREEIENGMEDYRIGQRCNGNGENIIPFTDEVVKQCVCGEYFTGPSDHCDTCLGIMYEVNPEDPAEEHVFKMLVHRVPLKCGIRNYVLDLTKKMVMLTDDQFTADTIKLLLIDIESKKGSMCYGCEDCETILGIESTLKDKIRGLICDEKKSNLAIVNNLLVQTSHPGKIVKEAIETGLLNFNGKSCGHCGPCVLIADIQSFLDGELPFVQMMQRRKPILGDLEKKGIVLTS